MSRKTMWKVALQVQMRISCGALLHSKAVRPAINNVFDHNELRRADPLKPQITANAPVFNRADLHFIDANQH